MPVDRQHRHNVHSTTAYDVHTMQSSFYLRRSAYCRVHVCVCVCIANLKLVTMCTYTNVNILAQFEWILLLLFLTPNTLMFCVEYYFACFETNAHMKWYILSIVTIAFCRQIYYNAVNDI